MDCFLMTMTKLIYFIYKSQLLLKDLVKIQEKIKFCKLIYFLLIFKSDLSR
jgi:hypothetical protein